MGFMRRRGKDQKGALREVLYAMDDVLEEVSLDALNARGEWDRAEFDEVLHRVEALTPAFQSALVDYLSSGAQHDHALVTALLAVDRLSAAYTYWTRLFPPRQSEQAMFVLSLLHDLGDKVVTAIETSEHSR